MKITPVLLVESVEKSLPFWMERMGWQKVVEVPEGEHLGFAILVHGAAELMLQTFESARKDQPELVGAAGLHRSSLFIEVDDWPDTLGRLQGYEISMPERDTFYGMREIGVIEPGGHTVVFAIPLQKQNSGA
jgi:hypothetical protein